VTVAAASAVPPAPPEVVRTAQDNGRSLRRLRRATLTFVVVMFLLVGLPSLALSGHINTEWSLAFGQTTTVNATVTGSSPSDQPSRTCSLTNIDVIWTAPVGDHYGQFTVCDDDASQFAVGTTVPVDVAPGDSSVIQGEDRGSAIFGVVLETIVLLFFLLLLGAAVRSWLVLLLAPRRWRDAPWLPGAAFPNGRGRGLGQPVLVIPVGGAVPWTRPLPPKRRSRTCLAVDVPADVGGLAESRGLEPHDAINLNVQRRPDAQLAAGDQVWVAPTGTPCAATAGPARTRSSVPLTGRCSGPPACRCRAKTGKPSPAPRVRPGVAADSPRPTKFQVVKIWSRCQSRYWRLGGSAPSGSRRRSRSGGRPKYWRAMGSALAASASDRATWMRRPPLTVSRPVSNATSCAGHPASPLRRSSRSAGELSFQGLMCPARSMRLAPNELGLRPQKTH
jgi:hypothetical protein